MGAFRWTAETGMVGLGDLPGRTAQGSTRTSAVSADGSVVVGNGFGVHGVFRWMEETGMVKLGASQAAPDVDVSSDGSVVVGLGRCERRGVEPFGSCSPEEDGFRWTEAEGMTPIPISARSVSGDGSVLLGGLNARFPIPGAAALWTLAGGVQPIPLPKATALSRDGRVAVGGAAFWSEETGTVLIAPVEGSEALAVSGEGSVIGGTEVSVPGARPTMEAFLWRAGDRARRLDEILVDEYDLDLGGWQLLEVRALSDDGLTIVGDGIDPGGVDEGWIAHLGDDVSCGPPSDLATRDGCGQVVRRDLTLDHDMDCPPGGMA